MFDEKDTEKIVGSLIEKIGSAEACYRLGFLVEADNGELAYTGAGFGYLLQVEAAELDSLAEAYAAGYQQGAEDWSGDRLAA